MSQSQPYIETTGSYPYATTRSDWIVDGSNSSFTLNYAPNPQLVRVLVNGLQVPFNFSGTANVLLGIVPQTGDEVTVIYWGL